MSPLSSRELELVRALARDVAHELRGPVQSILVNLEVLRRRAQNADASAVLERAEVIETEVRRMHELADSFLSLMRRPEPQAHPVAMETLLTAIDDIAAVRAKSARLKFQLAPVAEARLVRPSDVPLSLAALQAFVGVCGVLSPGDTIGLAVAADGDALELSINAEHDATKGDVDRDALGRVADDAALWLRAGGGTATVEAGSDTSFAVRLRLPNAILTTIVHES